VLSAENKLPVELSHEPKDTLTISIQMNEYASETGTPLYW